MADQMGVSFIPTAENQAQQGPQQGQMEGDLASAFKILSLRLPRVLGAQSIAPSSVMNGAGSAGALGGFNPYAAVFDALLKAAGLSGGSSGGSTGASGMPGSASGMPGGAPSVPAPRIGAGGSTPPPNIWNPPTPNPPTGGGRIRIPTNPGGATPPPPVQVGIPRTPAPPSWAPTLPTSPSPSSLGSPFSAQTDFRSWNSGGRGY